MHLHSIEGVLYDPIFWDDAQTVTIDNVNYEAGKCLVKRNIEYLLRIYMREGKNTSSGLFNVLEDLAYKGSLKT